MASSEKLIKKKRASIRANPRGPGFSAAETESMLNAIEDVTSVRLNEWEDVIGKHNLQWPKSGRAFDALRRKVTRMHTERAPTGNPYIPPLVLRAKKLREDIVVASEMVNADIADAAVGFSISQDVGVLASAVEDESIMDLTTSRGGYADAGVPSENGAVEVADSCEHTKTIPRPVADKRKTRASNTTTPSINIADLVQLQ